MLCPPRSYRWTRLDSTRFDSTRFASIRFDSRHPLFVIRPLQTFTVSPYLGFESHCPTPASSRSTRHLIRSDSEQIPVSRQPSNSDRPRFDPHSGAISSFVIFRTDHICSTVSHHPFRFHDDDRLARPTLRPPDSSSLNQHLPRPVVPCVDRTPCRAAPPRTTPKPITLPSPRMCPSHVCPQTRIAHRAFPSHPYLHLHWR
jgi:hypothetical protein